MRSAGEKLSRRVTVQEELELLRTSSCMRLDGTLIPQATNAKNRGRLVHISNRAKSVSLKESTHTNQVWVRHCAPP